MLQKARSIMGVHVLENEFGKKKTLMSGSQVSILTAKSNHLANLKQIQPKEKITARASTNSWPHP